MCRWMRSKSPWATSLLPPEKLPSSCGRPGRELRRACRPRGWPPGRSARSGRSSCVRASASPAAAGLRFPGQRRPSIARSCRAASAATMSGVSTSSSRSGPPVLRILCGATCHGPIVAGGGHGDQPVAARETPPAGGEHLLGRDDRHHFGRRRDTSTSTGPLTTTTWCPASTAAAASAAPIRPLEALVKIPHRVEVLPRRAGGDEDAGHGRRSWDLGIG